MNIAVFGYGMMGKFVCEDVTSAGLNIAGVIEKRDDVQAVAPVTSDILYKSLNDIREKVDVIIDFSNPANLDEILEFAIENQIGAVICSTGFTDEQLSKIKEASEKTAVLFSRNMSLGVNVISEALKQITPILADVFDIEIIEKHHNQKVDSPSGTAKLFYDSINESLNGEKEAVYGREGIVGKRTKREVGIHAIRGGSIVGEHSVIFAGQDEIIELKHEALSKRIFSQGSVKAAKFLVGKAPGFYTMKEVLNLK
jgi:4-hydroxy-tetrahydrodipicolinate reductase